MVNWHPLGTIWHPLEGPGRRLQSRVVGNGNMCFLFGSKTPFLSLHFLSFRSPNGCCNVLGGKRSMQRCWHVMRPCYKICHRTTVVVVCSGTGQGCVALEFAMRIFIAVSSTVFLWLEDCYSTCFNCFIYGFLASDEYCILFHWWLVFLWAVGWFLWECSILRKYCAQIHLFIKALFPFV